MMKEEKFDFGAMVDDQLKSIKPNFKFGNAFDADKSLQPRQRPAADAGSQSQAAAAYAAGAAIRGTVEKETKGGYEVTVAGERAFCPFSQIDRYRREGAEYIGRAFDFIVTEYSRDDRGVNIIVSRRALLDIQSEALKEALLAQLTEGETLHGTVVKVLDFGAFVDLGGVEGLIPAREIAWERTDDPAQVLHPGDGVTVKVVRIDREAGKISLSRRECLPRVFRKSAEETAAEANAAEFAAWQAETAKRNAAVGSMAEFFKGVKL